MFRKDIQEGETIVVGDVTITIEKKSGSRVRLAIDAPADMRIRMNGDESSNLRQKASIISS